MTNVDRLKAADMKRLVMKYRGEAPKGTNSDYITVYRDYCRNDGDYTESMKTSLYQKRGGEYCTLLEVLGNLYRDHQQAGRTVLN